MIYLEPEQHKALRAEVVGQGISMAELLRRLVKRHLEEGRASPQVPTGAFMKVVALGSSGRSDVSERHDAYLAQALRSDRPS